MSHPLNLELIRSRAAGIRGEMERLRQYGALTPGAFSGDADKVRAARYGLIVLVEAAAAICNHLCARQGRVSDSYPGCFELLGEVGVVDTALAGRLAAMARLRNLLVHGYGRIDDRQPGSVGTSHDIPRGTSDPLTRRITAPGLCREHFLTGYGYGLPGSRVPARSPQPTRLARSHGLEHRARPPVRRVRVALKEPAFSLKNRPER